MSNFHLFSYLMCLSVFVCVYADTPANCTYEDIQGDWIFHVTKRDSDNTINCSEPLQFATQYKVGLYFPSLALDSYGHTGYWTLIYNQGFEVVIGGDKYFAFSLYKQSGSVVTSLCDQTLPGWVHQSNERNWGCYVGQKVDNNVKRLVKQSVVKDTDKQAIDFSFVKDINSRQSSWKATENNVFVGMRQSEIVQMVGGQRSAGVFPPTANITQQHLQATKPLPAQFDWRNHNGVNYVSPIRNQEKCGSCYAFGSMALYEARERIVTNNSVQRVYSTQDIVSCSEYSQGCDGGFPYLIAGKYGQDFGLIEDECFQYEAKDAPCKKTTCQRHYPTDYYYVGGSYGACNEPLMREELVRKGPMAVSFEVYKDFTTYKSGIYHHVQLEESKYNPWEITNHVVLVVGYGEEDNVPYWIVKNSWGPEWGEDGFFRIRRGTDECSIENINSRQSSWKATENNVFVGMRQSKIVQMVGGQRSAGVFQPTANITQQHLQATKPLPAQFDWRNHNGVNYVSPIRNQEKCGSCYAFGSMALYEARERIMTNNSVQRVYSTQDIVSCSEYSQGCDGGFPYLIAGKCL